MKKSILLIVFILAALFATSFSFAGETRYASINYIVKDTHIFDEGNIDSIVDKIFKILDVQPEKFHVNFKVFPTHYFVEINFLIYYPQQSVKYEAKYGKGVYSYYNPKTKTIYTYQDVPIKTLAHEITHAVNDVVFHCNIPPKINEIISWHVEEYFD